MQLCNKCNKLLQGIVTPTGCKAVEEKECRHSIASSVTFASPSFDVLLSDTSTGYLIASHRKSYELYI